MPSSCSGFATTTSLARLTETPGLGHCPVWMWFWMALVACITTGGGTAAARS